MVMIHNMYRILLYQTKYYQYLQFYNITGNTRLYNIRRYTTVQKAKSPMYWLRILHKVQIHPNFIYIGSFATIMTWNSQC